MNDLGNRYVGKNVRLLLVNNGKGTEFRMYTHPGATFGEDADKFIAAGGHFGNKSPQLVKHYAQDLGYEYLCASSKEEFEQVYDLFISPKIGERSIIFEVFTNHEDESDALKLMNHIEEDVNLKMKSIIKKTCRKVIGDNVVQTVKKIIK